MVTLSSTTSSSEPSKAKATYRRLPLDDPAAKRLTTSFVEVSSVALGARVVKASDEFFAEKENLIKVEPSRSLKGTFGPNGALYDGWETRRHNSPNHDWAIIALGPSHGSVLHGFDIDTTNFNGNEGPEADVWGLSVDDQGGEEEAALDGDDPRWECILPIVPLGPSQRHLFELVEPTPKTYSHLKLRMLPDGGISRFRAYGVAQPPHAQQLVDGQVPRIDLASALVGGRVVAQSDQHFGIASNLLLPGRGVDMADGWETRRSRDPSHREWAIVRLAAGAGGKKQGATIDHVEIDTAYHMGNFPFRAEVCGAPAISNRGGDDDGEPPAHDDESRWDVLVPSFKTGPHRQHFMPVASGAVGKRYTHVKLTIFPDGGLKRLRIWGSLADDSYTTNSGTAPQPSLPTVEALPLTYEAFAPFGRVIQGYSTPTAVPRGLAVTLANQGTAWKVHKMAPVEHDYGSKGYSSISVVRAQPQATTGTTIDIRALERHPHTTQAFIPLGKPGQRRHDNPSNGAFVAVVALSDAQGQPDPSTIRAFLVPPSQGVSYGMNVWHHPLMTVDAALDYALVETRHQDEATAVTEMLTPTTPFARLVLPRLPHSPDNSAAAPLDALVIKAPTFSLKNLLPAAIAGKIKCEPLTREAFEPFGDVLQAWTQDEVPRGVKTVVDPKFKVTRYCDLAPVSSSYPAEAKAGTAISLFRASPKQGLARGKPWPVHFLERHPFTEQTFMPMGLGNWHGKGEESLPGGAAYVVIVAENGSDDRPDPSTIRAFLCETNQGINYRAGVWHHPMLVVGDGAIDLACVETQITHKADKRDCELLEFKEAVAVVDVSP